MKNCKDCVNRGRLTDDSSSSCSLSSSAKVCLRNKLRGYRLWRMGAINCAATGFVWNLSWRIVGGGAFHRWSSAATPGMGFGECFKMFRTQLSWNCQPEGESMFKAYFQWLPVHYPRCSFESCSTVHIASIYTAAIYKYHRRLISTHHWWSQYRFSVHGKQDLIVFFFFWGFELIFVFLLADAKFRL